MADLSDSILVCKRPHIELDPADAKKSGSIMTNCDDCKCEVYAMPKNLDRGMTVLCIPCAAKRSQSELEKGEPTVLIDGHAIGSPYEDQVKEAAEEFGEELKKLRDEEE